MTFTVGPKTAKRCAGLGLTIHGYTPGQHARVVVGCPHCGGLRNVLASEMGRWCRAGVVPACRSFVLSGSGCRFGKREFHTRGKT